MVERATEISEPFLAGAMPVPARARYHLSMGLGRYNLGWMRRDGALAAAAHRASPMLNRQ